MSIPTPTPHNTAAAGEIARTVLMPGDPKRAAYVAKEFLTEARLVNDVRGVQGYTGLWKGREVSVMASGMGIPSIGIYAWELFEGYGVQRILRIGTAGALADDLQLKDIVLAQGACTDSYFMNQFKLPGSFAPLGSYRLLEAACAAAREKGLPVRVGNILSTDRFYSASPEDNDQWKRMGVLAVEMEAAGLYAVAAYHGKEALAICSISDHLYREGQLSPTERAESLDRMIELALEASTMDNG